MKPKNFLILLLLLALSFTLFACSSASGQPAKDPIVLECLVTQPESHPQSAALQTFAETLAKKTKGAYTLNFTYVGDTLTAADVLLQVQEGTAAFALLPNVALTTCNFEFYMLEQPYLFDSPEEQLAIMNDSEISGELHESILADFVRVLAQFYNGTNHLASASAISGPTDLAGKAVYTTGELSTLPLLVSFGAVPAVLAEATVAECNILDYQASALYESMPYLTLTAHNMPPYAFIISEEIWASLSVSVQEIFKEELPGLAETAAKEVIKLEEEALAALEGACTIRTEFDKESCRALLPELLDFFLQVEISQDLYEDIQNYE